MVEGNSPTDVGRESYRFIDMAVIADNLDKRQDGVWVSRSRSSISYPEDGNLNCLALEEGSFWFEHRNRCILEVMRLYPPDGMVFDVGGGNGYVSFGLQQAGYPVALLEPGELGVVNAARRGVRTLICSTLEDAGFRAESMPAVGAFDVLEHIASDDVFLSKVHQLLIPGGRLYLTVPAYRFLWSADDDYAGHHRRYTKDSLTGSLSRAGFQVQLVTYIFSMLPLPIFLFRVLPSRLGIRKQHAWNSYTDEHSRRKGFLGWVLHKALQWEITRLRFRKTIPFGGSILVSARKLG